MVRQSRRQKESFGCSHHDLYIRRRGGRRADGMDGWRPRKTCPSAGTVPQLQRRVQRQKSGMAAAPKEKVQL